MSDTSQHTIIGLTGNIATGKSVVRRMLEHLGADGIDADKLAHQAIKRGSPGYELVLEEFGDHILTHNLEIDRSTLGSIVFQDDEALQRLESIIHPLVGLAIKELMDRSSADIVVIEAIKLIEAGLTEICDSLWVTTSDMDTQINRLRKDRGFDESEALARIQSQPAQSLKVSLADVVIMNNGSYQDVWEQVTDAWRVLFPDEKIPTDYPEAAAWLTP